MAVFAVKTVVEVLL